MKSLVSTSRALFALPLVTALLFGSIARAQTITSAVPGLISYQGRVSDAGGLVGATTPVNREVTFKIWNHQTDAGNANLVYSEKQVVTISGGEFSVLIGQGTVLTGVGNPGVNSVAVLTEAFTGHLRFLGITIDDPSVTTDPEISPRQQIVTSAFAMRARYAEALGTSASGANPVLTVLDTGKVGVGNTSPPAKLTVTGANVSTTTAEPQLVVTADDVTERLRIGVDSTGNGTGFVQMFKEGLAAQNLLLNPHGGNVGIGTGAVSPINRLEVNGVIGVYDGGSKNRNAGLGTEVNGQLINFGVNDSTSNRFGGTYTQASQGGLLRVDSRSGVNLFQFRGRAAGATSDAELVSITSLGNVGIGTTAPGDKLQIGDFSSGDGYLAIKSGGGNLYRTGLKFRHFNDTGGFNIESDERVGKNGLNFIRFPFGTEQTAMFIDRGTGNVALGTTDPAAKLDVAGNTDNAIQAILARGSDANFRLVAQNRSATNNVGAEVSRFGLAYGTTFYSGLAFMRGGGSTDSSMALHTGGSERMRLTSDGNFGIGTTTPTQGRLVVNGSSGSAPYNAGTNNYLTLNGLASTGAGSLNASIYATGYVLAPYFLCFSDQRVKRIEGLTSGSHDLDSLMRIEVTDFRYVDTVAQRPGSHKKVIAQQVEKVFPQAVNRATDVVPDIYRKATIQEGWVQLATDLKQGERVRLIGESTEGIYGVLEVEAGRFRTDFAAKGSEVFVYGREVKDFRVVDYEAIAMLNVSATQQIKREKDAEVKALQDENSELRARLAALEAKDKLRDSKLAAIERLLRAPDKATARPVSLKTSGTEE